MQSNLTSCLSTGWFQSRLFTGSFHLQADTHGWPGSWGLTLGGLTVTVPSWVLAALSYLTIYPCTPLRILCLLTSDPSLHVTPPPRHPSSTSPFLRLAPPPSPLIHLAPTLPRPSFTSLLLPHPSSTSPFLCLAGSSQRTSLLKREDWCPTRSSRRTRGVFDDEFNCNRRMITRKGLSPDPDLKRGGGG